MMNDPFELSEELERAKSLSFVELAHMLESTDGLYNIDNEECLLENETRALLEGIRQRVFLLFHDCFGSLRMSLFGYFVDDEAAITAIPFCRSLISLAVATDDVKLRLFIVNDLLPCLIRRLDNRLQYAIQRLIHKLSSSASDNASRDLVILCQELYGYLLKQDLAGEGKESGHADNNFTVWMAKQKEDLEVKSYSSVKELPEGFEWNWEFEEEFQRYLPIYVDMLKEVDAIPMDNSEECDYLKEETLFQKLKPEFKSKYAMNSCLHPYMITISSLRQEEKHFTELVDEFSDSFRWAFASQTLCDQRNH